MLQEGAGRHRLEVVHAVLVVIAGREAEEGTVRVELGRQRVLVDQRRRLGGSG